MSYHWLHNEYTHDKLYYVANSDGKINVPMRLVRENRATLFDNFEGEQMLQVGNFANGLYDMRDRVFLMFWAESPYRWMLFDPEKWLERLSIQMGVEGPEYGQEPLQLVSFLGDHCVTRYARIVRVHGARWEIQMGMLTDNGFLPWTCLEINAFALDELIKRIRWAVDVGVPNNRLRMRVETL